MFARFAREGVDSAEAAVLGFVIVHGFGKLQYIVLVFKCYFEVSMFK
jgi:hypothetical protein